MITRRLSDALSLSAAQGVPSGALHRWGHSMVIVGSKLVIFGGYGGAGAHRRLDDVLVYDIPTGIVRQLHVAGVLLLHVACCNTCSLKLGWGKALATHAGAKQSAGHCKS